MKPNNKIFFILNILIILFTLSCNEKKNNPITNNIHNNDPIASSLGNIKGRITDSLTGNFIFEAKVEINNKLTTTSSNGIFEFNEIPKGEYAIKSTKFHYKPFSGIINILENKTILYEIKMIYDNAPNSNAGEDQEVIIGSIVNLDGSKSNDTANDSLIYKWELIAKPADSLAYLSDNTVFNPKLITDKEGIYKIGLTVNDGTSNSNEDLLEIKAIDTEPPDTPKNIIIEENFDDKIIITWENIFSAKKYNIYWSTNSGVTTTNYEEKFSILDKISFIHDNAIFGNTYYYIITSENIYGESQASNEININHINKSTINISVNPIESLNGFTLQQIADFRIKKVNKYSYLNIFPTDYNPINAPHSNVYGKITSGADWVNDTQYYICNPYQLIITTLSPYINPFAVYAGITDITYNKKTKTIEEIYKNENAILWFNKLDYTGTIRLWMVNAYDAKFPYISVDRSRSCNITPNTNTSTHVMNSIYSLVEYYHYGQYSKNNISPLGPNANIKVVNEYESTKIFVKLWRNKPASKDDKEDFTYIIKVYPDSY